MSKVICVLYPDPVDGYPKSYVRDDLPKLTHYPGGQTLPTPKEIDFVPGHLLGSVSGELACANSSSTGGGPALQGLPCFPREDSTSTAAKSPQHL